MRIDVITIFPEYLEPLQESLLGRAMKEGILSVGVHNLRDWAHDKHQKVDDTPFGGGPGMVMMPHIWAEAIGDTIKKVGHADHSQEEPLIIIPTPAGQPFSQEIAQELSQEKHLIFACGRYEGIDQRVVDWASDTYRVREISIGDYVLIGGEVATMVMVEAATRLIPGVLGNTQSYEEDSFSDGLLEAPCYTKPRLWRGYEVPEVLLSGNHQKIENWRRQQSLIRTAEVRPDIIRELDIEELDTADRIAIEGRRLSYTFGPVEWKKSPEELVKKAEKLLKRFDTKSTIDMRMSVENKEEDIFFIHISAHTTKEEENYQGLIEARLGKLL